MIFWAAAVLNMRSMRSVMKNPPTMLLKEAATAITPRMVESRVSCRPAMMIARDHHDGVERIGQRHQRRVQQRRNALITSKPTKPGQDENIKIRDEIRRHSFLLSALSRPQRRQLRKIPRTRGFTISPPRVNKFRG